eukprot:345654_1
MISYLFIALATLVFGQNQQQQESNQSILCNDKSSNQSIEWWQQDTCAGLDECERTFTKDNHSISEHFDFIFVITSSERKHSTIDLMKNHYMINENKLIFIEA